MTEKFRNLAITTSVILLILGVGALSGCAKKQITKNEAPVSAPGSTSREPTMGDLDRQKEGVVTSQRVLSEGFQAEIDAFENECIYFDFDQHTLTSPARATLAKKAKFLKDHPDVNIEIQGHCDERGTTEYNMALGERRALSAKGYLKNSGIEEQRIKTISYGEERPVDTGHDETAWARNRRAQFVIVNKS